MPMISLAEARAYVTESCRVLDAVDCRIADSLHCVLAADVVARESVPPFANTAMDGFAVRAADTASAKAKSPAPLRVIGTLAAGHAPTEVVGPGEAVRIMTGAPIPEGADAIVKVERTVTSDDGSTVEVAKPASVGDHIRPAGDDVRAGEVVFEAGTVVRPAHLGVLASIGVDSVRVVPRVRVGVLSTGDELVDDGSPLQVGQIRDSNRIMLVALANEAGCDVVDLGLVRDDEDAIEQAMTNGVAECDVLLTSGGVSMGDFDYVKVVLDRLGSMRWMQVAIKPAKPLAFGTIARDEQRRVPVFGLPGNPVSSMVSFEVFARPFLRTMMGFTGAAAARKHVRAVAHEPISRREDGKTHFVRVTCDWNEEAGHHRVRPAAGQASHQLAAAAGANGLAILPDGPGVDSGDEVAVMLLG